MESLKMIPVFPNPYHVGLPPTPIGNDFPIMSLLDEIADMQNSELEKLIFKDSTSCEDSFLDEVDLYVGGFDLKPVAVDKVLRNNCKWSGCDPECAKTHGTNACFDSEEFMSPNDMYSHFVFPAVEVTSYSWDNDHTYFAPASKQTVNEPDDKLEVLKNIPTPPSTSDSPSETSSEDEVDVVTVPEEYKPPVVSRHDYLPRRSARSQKYVKTKRTQQSQISAKSLKAAMKRTKMQPVRRPYKRRKINNSVETTPSSSIPSSAHSSRCNSDNEDVDKRRTHNSSERKRREAQRTALQNLRVCIPNLQDNLKAAKVTILNNATSLVKKLKHDRRNLKELKSRELQRRKDLLAKLNMLRNKFSKSM